MILRCAALALLLLSGCASLGEVDQSLLNHKAMDLHTRLTPERATYLTTLDMGSLANRSGGVCVACAH
jgi:hypothetical protein